MILYDKVFINGKVFTCDNKDSRAEAVGVIDGRISFVGNNTDINKFIGENTEVIDLENKLMLPGFIDCHVHFLEGGLQLGKIDFTEIYTKNEFSLKVEKYIAENKADWILGGNWDHQKISEKKLPCKEWIDEITGDKPFWATRTDLHMGLANSAALKLAGINNSTSDPEGGLIVRDELGNPTGMLKDEAMKLIQKLIPQPEKHDLKIAMRNAFSEAAKNGVTTITDICDAKSIEIYKELLREEKLTCRINGVLPIDQIEKVEKLKINSEMIKVNAVKAFIDGSIGSETAWFYEPYINNPNFSGLPMIQFSNGKLKKLALEADRKGMQLIIHAIGDKAIEALLEMYDEIISVNGKRDRRSRVEHVQHIQNKEIEKMRELDIIASVQPSHLIDDAPWIKNVISESVVNSSYRFRSLIDAEVRTCFGSDWTVSSLNPIKAIYAAVNRTYANNEVFLEDEKISVLEAVRCSTINGAYGNFMEKSAGSIEIGKFADMVVLDQNIFEIEHEKIINTKVIKTVCNGKIVFGK
ncbi:MAG: amidohydrolase [Melioribacteraceae bacterium]|nr:amidohydrolase [Melioribacteraceae bacterium]